MENVLLLFMRRMRTPLILLIAVYAVSVGGLVLIPGVDDQGQPWHLSFFHAFYFVSFMATTIGFGEIPYPFSDAQRIWVSVCIFLTVIAWIYAIGRILALVQDPAFSRAVTEARFTRAVRAITDPFYIVCGYGETGSLLVRALARRNIQCVVIDQNTDRLSMLQLENLGMDIPSMFGDAGETHHLQEAGLCHRFCRGVVAITNRDDVNVRISLTSKLLQPDRLVISRVGAQEAADNLASFGTDYAINAYQVFGEHFGMTLRSPSIHLLHAWLISLPGRKLHPPVRPPRGKWVVCGFGRFGESMHRVLLNEGCDVTIIELNEAKLPAGGILGPAHEAGPLLKAGVRDAVGIVVGIDTDTNTLSAVMTARQLNPRLYMVARQFRRASAATFEAARIDLVMEPSRLIVWRILPLINRPLLSRFLHRLRGESESFAAEVLRQIHGVSGDLTPQNWAVDISSEDATGVFAMLAAGTPVQLSDLLRDPRDRLARVPCLVLLLTRGASDYLMPPEDMPLQAGDRLLFCAREGARSQIEWLLHNSKVLEYVMSGVENPDGVIWRWLSRRMRARRKREPSN